MQFIDSLLLVLGKENPTFLDYFTTKLTLQNNSNPTCPRCKSPVTLVEDHRQFNFIGDGIISQLLLQDLYLKVTCNCENLLDVLVELPQHLLIRYNMIAPSQFAIDTSFSLGIDIKYKLTAIASTSGNHATCYIEKGDQWYSFSDYYYYLVDFGGLPFFILPRCQRPLGLVYSLEGDNSCAKITSKTVIDLMNYFKILKPSDPFTPCPVPETLRVMTKAKIFINWDKLVVPELISIKQKK